MKRTNVLKVPKLKKKRKLNEYQSIIMITETGSRRYPGGVSSFSLINYPLLQQVKNNIETEFIKELNRRRDQLLKDLTAKGIPMDILHDAKFPQLSPLKIDLLSRAPVGKNLPPEAKDRCQALSKAYHRCPMNKKHAGNMCQRHHASGASPAPETSSMPGGHRGLEKPPNSASPNSASLPGSTGDLVKSFRTLPNHPNWQMFSLTCHTGRKNYQFPQEKLDDLYCPVTLVKIDGETYIQCTDSRLFDITENVKLVGARMNDNLIKWY